MARYQDISASFSAHPLTGDLIVKEDAEAIKQSVKNLILYNFYDKPFNPTVGSEITGFLFNNGSPADKILLENAIRRVIENFEPRANIINVKVELINENIRAYIQFSVLNLAQLIDVEFFLNKVR